MKEKQKTTLTLLLSIASALRNQALECLKVVPQSLSAIPTAFSLGVSAGILILAGGVFHGSDAVAATPHSYPKSCGTIGGPACPAPVPIITPWLYMPQSSFPPGGPGAGFNSIAAMNSFLLAWEYQQPVNCSSTYVSSAPWGAPSYSYGIEVSQGIETTNYNIQSPQQSPPCTNQINFGVYVAAQRTVNCPVGSTLTYQSSPAVGPYCGTQPQPPPPQIPANLLKQNGNCCGEVTPGISPSSNMGGADAGSGRTTKGNPVDVSNGNKYQSEIDYVGAGTNALRFSRSYNSLSAYLLRYNGAARPVQSAVMGEAWSATYFQFLTVESVTDATTTYSTVLAYRPDGRVITFNQYNGTYSPDGDVADSLLRTANGWQYQTVDDTIETFDTNGQLLTVAARGQAPVTITRPNAFDPPSSATDSFGHVLSFTYLIDSRGFQRLASIKDPAGKAIGYTYDSNGSLTSVTYADGSTRLYGYTAPLNGWLLTGITDEANVAYASWTYTQWGDQALSSQHAGGVEAYSFSYVTNAADVITSATVIDPFNQSRTYTQQMLWGVNRTTASSASCPTCVEDRSRTLDANGDVTARSDWNGNQTSYVYDHATNLETSRIEALGATQARTIATQWNASWREPALVTEPNRTTGWTYDAMGNLLQKTMTDTTVGPNVTRTWTYTYDGYGRMLTADGPRTDVTDKTTYAYYTCTTGVQCGELHTISNALSQVTTFNTYNAHGQPLTITDPNGVVTTLAYDSRERLLSIEVGTETTTYTYWPTGLLKLVTLPDSSTMLFAYDLAHRLTTITDGTGNYISYTLDALGNRTAESAYDPSGVLHRTHSRVFNALDQLYQDINSAGTAAVTTTLGYDTQGNLTSSAAPLSRSTGNQYDALNRINRITDPNSGVTKLGYDANDNLATVTDPRTFTTSYTHNGFDDVTKLVSPDTGTLNKTYDSGGNLKTTTDARGAVATYTYDSMNRVTQVAYSDQTINYGYDAGTNGKGHLTSASDATHSMSFTYDALGRVIGKGQTVAGITKSVGYTYTNGDLTTLVTPSGQTITYAYTNHQVTSIKVGSTTLLSSVTYDPFGPATAWTWGNSSSVSRAFDEDGNPHQIVTAAVTNSYTVDAASRITNITDSGLSSATWNFTSYDALDRIKAASSSAKSRGYTYDANGNRLTTTGTTASTESIATTSNRLSSTSGGLVRTYGYDAAGNTTSFTGETFTFNQRGRMSTATSSSATSYVYNALGQLIEKSGNGGTTLLMYDEQGHLLGEYTSTGALIQETVWMGDTPVATLRPNGSAITIYYVHTDHLGTPRKITNPSGNAVVWRWDPDTFGSVAPSIATISYNLRFPGQYYLPESGLHYNYFRTYDPQMGRYLESDPIGLGGGINTYSYVGGIPISDIDPLGLKAWSELETLQLLQQAYASATAGRVQGYLNIYNNSKGNGPYDFGWNTDTMYDTWNRCGTTMDADHFANYIAGFQGAAYDSEFFWTAGWRAEMLVEGAGIAYHLTGKTKAKGDPFDATGLPLIHAGEADGWNFPKNSKNGCGCNQ